MSQPTPIPSITPSTGATDDRQPEERSRWHAVRRWMRDASLRDVPPPPRVKGLLSAPQPALREAARVVSQSAPVAFGELNEIYLRGRYVLHHDVNRGILDELVDEGIRAAALGTSGAGELSTNDAAALAQRVRYSAQFLSRREGEIARRRYARGLLLGVGVSLIVLIVTYALAVTVIRLWPSGAGTAGIPPEQLDAIRDVLVAVGGGAAGACVSVLLRLHKVRNLTFEAAFGGAAQYRIYLGWFFAAAVVFLLKSGILASFVVVPDASAGGAERVESWFFWGAVGFLAGFNERWATNLIARDPGGSLAGTPAADSARSGDSDSIEKT